MEPERRIEKWLRAFAKKRREQAGEPMHLRESTRHRFQREVARLSAEKSHGGFFSSLFFGPRPRLVFAACFTALALGGWFLWRQSTGTEPATLSMNKPPYQEIASAPAAPAAPPSPVMSPAMASDDKKVLTEKQSFVPPPPQPSQPTIVAANRSLTTAPADTLKERNRAESVFQQKQLTVTTAAAPATDVALAFKNETAPGSLSSAGSLAKDRAGALPATVAPQTSNFIAGTIYSDTDGQTLKSTLALQGASALNGSTNMALFDRAKATSAATVSQVFNRLDTSSTRRTAIAAPAGVPVLASFRVEQSGNNLKVVDGDGSVYTGSVQIAQQEPPADESFAAAKSQPADAVRAAKSSTSAPQNYFFRVAGTNRNLKANVVFSGNFVPFTNDQFAAGARGFGGFAGGGGGGVGGQAPGGSNQEAGQPVQAILSNSQITGNVVIDNQKAIHVIATPAH